MEGGGRSGSEGKGAWSNVGGGTENKRDGYIGGGRAGGRSEMGKRKEGVVGGGGLVLGGSFK